MSDQFMPAVYSLIEAVADGKIGEGEVEFHDDREEVDVSIAVSVRRETKHLVMPAGTGD